jgi:hypothetical protein
MKENLANLQGKFIGEGINHEGQKFTGEFIATPIENKSGLAFSFKATGRNNEIYHAESSLIGKSMSGQEALWVLSSNHPGVFERKLKSKEEYANGTRYIFGFGNPEDKNSFREEILIEHEQNSIKYVYYWGMPGGDFAERSGYKMILQ